MKSMPWWVIHQGFFVSGPVNRMRGDSSAARFEPRESVKIKIGINQRTLNPL
jgi:hypothetical protein